MSDYERVKKWRNKPENKTKHRDYMRKRREYFRQMFKEGRIDYQEIPVSYRTRKI